MNGKMLLLILHKERDSMSEQVYNCLMGCLICWLSSIAIVVVGAIVSNVGLSIKNTWGKVLFFLGLGTCYSGQLIGGLSILVASAVGIVCLLQYLQVL